MNERSAERYSRQILFPPIGAEGQARLGASSAALVGCGALGASIADMLVRAGLGRLRIVDRDFVEESNLQRQTLFDESDVRETRPKAEAARLRLSRVNAGVAVESRVEDLRPDNAAAILDGFDLLLDGTDNFGTRYLINDVSISRGVPWIYGGAVGASGLSLAVLPGRTACLRCLFPSPPPEGSTPTCDTAGVVAPAIGMVASLEVAAALQILSRGECAFAGSMRAIDAWDGTVRVLKVERRPDCPACVERRFEFLEGEEGGSAATLCGRDAVQIRPRGAGRAVDLAGVANRLATAGEVVARNEFLVRVRLEGREIVLFADGRALVRGAADVAEARSLYSRFVGD